MPIAAVGLAVVELIAALAPWVAAYFILGHNPQAIEKNIEAFGSAITSGPVNTAVNAWIKVAVLFSGMGIGVWLLENKIVEKQGGGPIAPPPLQSIGPPAPPSFGAGSGLGFSAGPFQATQGVSVGGGGAPPPVSVSPPPPRQGTRFGASREIINRHAEQRARQDEQARQDRLRREERATQERQRAEDFARRQQEQRFAAQQRASEAEAQFRRQQALNEQQRQAQLDLARMRGTGLPTAIPVGSGGGGRGRRRRP